MTLFERHRGETATIVGRGPSLLELTRKDFGPGPVITLNHAILKIRDLHLPNPVYSMQKDGCLVEPKAPEILILSKEQSRQCYPDYEPRYVVDVHALKLPTHCMSLAFATALSIHMGCSSIKVLACDAVKGDFRTVVDDELVKIGMGYLYAVKQATRYAARKRVPVEFA